MNIKQHTLLPILIAAGKAGMTTTEMAMRPEFADAYTDESAAAAGRQGYKHPAHQYRSNRVSCVMRELELRGVVEHVGYGVSTLYPGHNIPIKRWRAIQPAADQFMQLPSPEQRKAARRAQELQYRRAVDANRKRREALVAEAMLNYGRGTPKCVRTRVCRELRAQKVSLDDIGRVFGITRERARQIIAGQHPGRPCTCSDCLKENWRGSIIEPEVFSPWADGRIDGPTRADRPRHAS